MSKLKPRCAWVGVVLLLTATAMPAVAQEMSKNHLDLVPTDAIGFLTVNMTDIWQDDLIKGFLKASQGDPEFGNILADIEKHSGLDAKQILRVSVILLNTKIDGPGDPTVVAVTTMKPVDKMKVLSSIAIKENKESPGYTEKKTDSGKTYYEGRGSLSFVGDNTVIAGSNIILPAYLNSKIDPTKEGRFKGIGELVAKNSVAAAVDLAELPKEFWTVKPFSELEGLAPLMKAKPALLTVSVAKDSIAKLKLTFFREAEAKDGEKAAEAVLTQLHTKLQEPLKELAHLVNDPKAKDQGAIQKMLLKESISTLEAIDASLKTATVTRQDSDVEVVLKAKVSSGRAVMVSLGWLLAGSSKPAPSGMNIKPEPGKNPNPGVKPVKP